MMREAIRQLPEALRFAVSLRELAGMAAPALIRISAT
jgi:hypothetical protein